MSGALALAGAAAIAVGGGFACFRRLFVAGLLCQAAGAALVGASGIAILVDGRPVGAAFTGQLEPHLGLDRLSAVFLLAFGLVGAPALVFATRYLMPTPAGRVVGGLTAAFSLSMVLLLSARDPLLFLTGWELMSLAPAATILVTRGASRSVRHAVFVYVALTHLAGAGTWIAVLLVAHTGGMESAGAFATGSGLQVAVALTALVGMGAKAGLVPLHTWLPRAHPIAPAHISALMSGVMVKVALYGLIRVLAEWLGVLPVWVGAAVLAAGAVSAVTGIVYALFQRELKRLLAFSTVENVGIVTLALGAALVLRSRGADGWAGVALAAGLLHAVNHSAFKGLLFLGAGAFERAVGSLEIDRLGGLLRRLPLAGTAFLAGCVAIAGVPPFNGFASEWLTLQVLLRVPGEGGLPDGVIGAVGLGALAGTAALAVFCFVKVVGLVLLGPARVDLGARTRELPRAMTGALVFLALACLALGVAPGLLYGRLTTIEPWGVPTATRTGIAVPSLAALPTGGITVILVALTCALVLVRRGRGAAAQAPTWACGQLVEPSLAWTSAGFTKPLRLVLETLLRPEREVEVISRGGVIQRVSYVGAVPHLFDVHLYQPVTRAALAGAAQARRLQSGRLGTYVAYLMGLVLVLLALAKWGVVG